MPYAANDDLPPGVRDHLPQHAQDIFREAFNHAWQSHSGDEATTVFDLRHLGVPSVIGDIDKNLSHFTPSLVGRDSSLRSE